MFLFVEMQPYLGYGHTRGGETFLEAAAVMHVGIEGRFAHVARAEPAHGKSVPAAKEDSHASGCREPAPVAPVVGPLAFFVGFHPEHVVVHVLAVHPFRQEIDDCAAACAVYAGYDDEQRNLAVHALPLRLKKLHAQIRGLFLVFPVAATSAKYDCFKHGNLVFLRSGERRA